MIAFRKEVILQRCKMCASSRAEDGVGTTRAGVADWMAPEARLAQEWQARGSLPAEWQRYARRAYEEELWLEMGQPEDDKWLLTAKWEVIPKLVELFECIWEMAEWKEVLAGKLRASGGKVAMSDHFGRLKVYEDELKRKAKGYAQAKERAQMLFDRKKKLYSGEEHWLYLVRAAGHPLSGWGGMD